MLQQLFVLREQISFACWFTLCAYHVLYALTVDVFARWSVSEMTYSVSSGTLNPTIPYHFARWCLIIAVMSCIPIVNTYNLFSCFLCSCRLLLKNKRKLIFLVSSTRTVISTSTMPFNQSYPVTVVHIFLIKLMLLKSPSTIPFNRLCYWM